jgi:hypothetical protein
MTMTISVIITLCVQVLGLGIFIGVTRAQNLNTQQRLQRIEDKQDKNNEEMVELRERVAVIESVLEIKRK